MKSDIKERRRSSRRIVARDTMTILAEEVGGCVQDDAIVLLPRNMLIREARRRGAHYYAVALR